MKANIYNLETLGRTTWRGVRYVVYSDGAYRHAVRARYYDAPALDGEDYSDWCQRSSQFPSDATAAKIARKCGLSFVNSAHDGMCSRLDVEAV